MIASILRIASIAATVVLLLSFGMFAADEAGHGSRTQVAQIGAAEEPTTRTTIDIDSPAPDTRSERTRERRHSSVRETIDDADDALVSPFKGAASSGSIWMQRGIPTLLALLVFGVGLRLAAAYLPASRG